MMNAGAANSIQTNRRQFVQAGVGVGAAGLAALGGLERALAADAAQPARPAESLIKPGDVVLFQGDSITDAGRKKDDPAANSPAALGNNYAWFAASQLLVDSPEAKLKIFNRGISGNKVFMLTERWQKDCLDLKPNVLSILIGVNDYWHMKKHGYDGTLEKYETDYRTLLQRTKDALPDVKLVICEPFILEVGAVDASWAPEFDGYRAAARKVADEMRATFIPFQTMFDRAIEFAPPATWAADGVHPTPCGGALMAHWWMRGVGGCG